MIYHRWGRWRGRWGRVKRTQHSLAPEHTVPRAGTTSENFKVLHGPSVLRILLKKDGGALQFSPVQSLSHVQLFVAPWTTAHQASLSITNSWSSPKPTFIQSVMPSNHLILCHPLLLLPSIFPSIRVFSNESALRIRWPKFWSFSFNISPSNEHSGLISFRMNWLDFLAVQVTLKSLLQHHSSRASILQHSAFFIVQLSHPYMTTWLDGPLSTKQCLCFLICYLGWS